MTNLTHYDPFGNIDDLFKGFFVRPIRVGGDLAEPMNIKVDVTKTDDTYTVKAEMPGVKKDDIHVSIEGNMVTISGEVKKEKEEKKGEQVLRSERYYGSVSRSFTLPQDIDETKSKATYNDGVLQLALSTKAVARNKELAIS